MSERLRLGTAVFADMKLPRALEWARDAEAAGFEWIGIPDSPMLIRELFVTCTALALDTERVAFAPMVTNPVSRHPSVTAGAVFTLEDIAPGRVSVGIGSGDSALYGVGLQGAKVDLIREYILAVKGLLRGEEVTWQGQSFHAAWNDWAPPVDVKFYVSCHGPRTMKMAGAVADGVISGHGLLPENIQYVKDMVAEGAREAGRDPSEVDIWWHPFVTLAPSIEDEVFAGFTTHFLTRFTMEGKQIPEEFKAPIRQMAEEAGRLETHGRINPELAHMAKETGLLEYLSKREGGFVGPPEAWRDRIEELRSHGADSLILAPLGPNGHEMMRALAEKVLPHLD